jgi:hypothetical protein
VVALVFQFGSEQLMFEFVDRIFFGFQLISEGNVVGPLDD